MLKMKYPAGMLVTPSKAQQSSTMSGLFFCYSCENNFYASYEAYLSWCFSESLYIPDSKISCPRCESNLWMVIGATYDKTVASFPKLFAMAPTLTRLIEGVNDKRTLVHEVERVRTIYLHMLKNISAVKLFGSNYLHTVQNKLIEWGDNEESTRSAQMQRAIANEFGPKFFPH